MKSTKHSELQTIGRGYLLQKNYWICGEEVPMPRGICDVWGMSRCNNYETMAIEVKISRPDFRSRSQQGKEFGSDLANYHYILCPAGLIQPEEVHEKWGLLWEVNGKIKNKKKSPFIEITAEDKLKVLIYFLNNGQNKNRPRFPNNVIEVPLQENLLEVLAPPVT